MSTGFENNMKFIICVILLVHMVLFIYTALEFGLSPSWNRNVSTADATNDGKVSQKID